MTVTVTDKQDKLSFVTARRGVNPADKLRQFASLSLPEFQRLKASHPTTFPGFPLILLMLMRVKC